jgi:hypothetical protein
MSESRIPDLVELSTNGMLMWFAEMSVRDLIFHPEDPPRSIIDIADGARSFDDAECEKLEGILATMYEALGDGVIEAAYPIFMKKAGQMIALDS